ncbi:PREDICTED: uncharacterized protein LOC109241530 [Nicotiana attenuata]|uniref:uncharacterized protein LOC109241530 n=1 Tax=Nicotiana attenuata TaxID=49451 RepID=UPI000905650B|nr:PREDICTED: uncharacterized protein LOC109241530 [Nicotiana attenuata]
MKIKILWWNVRRLNEAEKRRLVKSLIKKWNTDIVCLSETKLKQCNCSLMRQSGGSRWTDWLELKATGNSGGILLIWDKRRWSCNEKLVGEYSASVFLEDKNSDFKFSFSGVYGPCDRKRSKELWKELGAAARLEDWPWVVGGDFNITRFEDERTGRAKYTRAMRDFSRFIDDMGLIDLPLHGGQYMWNSYDFQGRPDVVLAKKLRKLKEDLKKWNKDTFGHLGTRKDQILHQLEIEQQNDNHDSNTEEEESVRNALTNELHHIAKKKRAGDLHGIVQNLLASVTKRKSGWRDL